MPLIPKEIYSLVERKRRSRWVADEMRRNAYGFEIDRKFYREAKEKMIAPEVMRQYTIDDIFIEARKIEQMTLAGVIA